jgi:hypothetical protein
MKTTFFLMILLFIGCTTIKKTNNAMSDTGYKPFKEYKGDTLNYLKNNFITNKQRYIGQKLEVLFKDLEFPVKSFVYSIIFTNKDYSDGIAVSFYDRITTAMNTGVEDKAKFYVLSFDLTQPVLVDSIRMQIKRYGEWSPYHEKFLGEQRVKDIYLLVFPIKK